LKIQVLIEREKTSKVKHDRYKNIGMRWKKWTPVKRHFEDFFQIPQGFYIPKKMKCISLLIYWFLLYIWTSCVPPLKPPIVQLSG